MRTPGRGSTTQARSGIVTAETVLASASPSGAARLVEWNTSEWVGQTVELALEDDSSEGALAADEFVVY